jgi:putative DNA primase/helicase
MSEGAIPIEDWMKRKNGSGGSSELAEHLPTQSEARLAEIYVKRHAGRLCYVERRNRWMEWSGHKWCEDDTLRGFDLAREICLEEARSLDNKARDAITCTSAKTVAAVEKQARAHRRLAARVQDFDADLAMVNTPEEEVICNLPNGPTSK